MFYDTKLHWNTPDNDYIISVLVGVRAMPKNELEGLPVIDVAESEKINVAVSQDDLQAGNQKTQRTIRLRLPCDVCAASMMPA